jgi:glycosyltransferase involved in cell wall biosynthesis
MKTITRYKRDIIKLFNQTNGDNLDNGMTWYKDANVYARTLAKDFDIPLNKVIGVMAALSPNNKWARNKIDTRNFLAVPSLETKVCTFMNQRKKALAILESSGTHEDIETILNGIKTKNFYHNISFYLDSDKVTVDMWAFRSVGAEEKLKNVPLVTQAYQELAQELNIVPHQLQAVVWGVIRGSLV